MVSVFSLMQFCLLGTEHPFSIKVQNDQCSPMLARPHTKNHSLCARSYFYYLLVFYCSVHFNATRDVSYLKPDDFKSNPTSEQLNLVEPCVVVFSTMASHGKDAGFDQSGRIDSGRFHSNTGLAQVDMFVKGVRVHSMW